MSRRLANALALAAFAALAPAAFAEDGPRVRIESVGGSRLVGTLKVKSISIQADFGRVEVDPSKIKSLSFGDRDGDTIVTTSGSIIKGKIGEDAFEIDSEFGTLKLERSRLRSLTLAKDTPTDARPDEPKGDPKPDEAKPETKPDPQKPADEERATRPRPIPRYITQPSATRVTKIPAGRAPRRIVPPSPPRPPIHLPDRYSSSTSRNLRVSGP